ncbi:hypothetical protein [Streptomyces chromofuscus]|uniref:hypothetical protein n=1 Tax=Streptomyces chromofuscus TaxID=42881 RepID=UPI0019C3022D|nr:hypothetical protein [Streptomyces chromofuscus]GGT40770.1 hypothetical protein GCM10010254_70840 [Streptomyces chromofuscus]
MRGQPVRRIASSALCATFLLGIAAPAAVAADHASARSRASTPVPGADELLLQLEYLDNLDTALTPVTDVLDTVLTDEDGQLTEEQASELGDAVREAIAEILAGMPVLSPSVASPSVVLPSAPSVPAAPSTPAAPVVPAASATPAAPSSPAAPSAPAAPSTPAAPESPAAPAATTLPAAVEDESEAVAADIPQDALAELEKVVADLLEAATSGVVTQVVPAATNVLTDLVDVLTVALGGALPEPSRSARTPAP